MKLTDKNLDVTREYGVTRKQLNGFARRTDAEIAADKKHGHLRLFSGDLSKDLKRSGRRSSSRSGS